MYHIEGRFVYGDDVYVDDGYMDEEWEYINGFPDYMISNKAKVIHGKRHTAGGYLFKEVM